MSNVFGLVLFVVFCTAVVSAAAGITWVVVKLSPPKKPQSPPA
ncbi:MAG TPA: hypothetical protein VKC62_01040 [Gaiellaceae bacterium]|nr:hypothetical protein [Gaiellaceae bacterium]